MSNEEYIFLERVNSPEELRKLSVAQLADYCDELRRYIIEVCSVNPGHLGSSLGAVELAVAIHYVFDTPYDKLIWDVGHQAYAHKIITGRRDAFRCQRKLGGISGFPRMCESEYDTFSSGHASVSISAAFGMAKAAELKGEERKVVAVIGDGAMTGGLAFEGLNNAGDSKTNDLLVILNDNNMAIDEPTGALGRYLVRVSTSQSYNRLKSWLWRGLRHVPLVLNMLRKAGNAVKQGLLQNSNIFESLNFRYFGRIDGNDIRELVRTLTDLKRIKGPKLLHVVTVKGKGYAPAEHHQTDFHAPGRFDPETGERLVSRQTADRYQDVFGETLLELAREDERVVGITPAMPTGCSMHIMMREMPDRCFDVGIAEEHAVTFSAGLATAGMIPFCNIYSTFMQRAYDNIIHDVAIPKLPVVLCLDRSGIVGEDGATHHGAFDMACLGCVPNLVIGAPADERELRNMMYTALNSGVPFVIRYPRGCGTGAEWRNKPFEMLPAGKARWLKNGVGIAVISIGATYGSVRDAIAVADAEGFDVAHIDMRFVKPLDEDVLHRIGARFRRVITVEDGVVRGGVGETIAAFFVREGYREVEVCTLGIGDRFVEHGAPDELKGQCGYDTRGILRAIRNEK